MKDLPISQSLTNKANRSEHAYEERQAKKNQKRFVLEDNNPDFDTRVAVTVRLDNGFLQVLPAGYGEPGAAPGHGSPVVLEVYEGQLRVIVHPDILDETNQVIIPLDNAREDRVG